MSIVSKTTTKQTTTSIQKRKGGEVITMITAYDALFARLFDGNVDIILVGDSLQMSFNGDSDTLPASLDIMIYHTKAVCQGAKNSLIVLDMPFGTYLDEKDALTNAVRVYQETKASAIKIEGGENKAHIIKHLTNNGIAVMGHIGLLPQQVRAEGGYKVKGKSESEKEQLIRDAKAVEKAGAFCMVIEGVVADVATEVAKAVNIPLIGIGAGNNVDGQVLVWSDAFGFFEAFKPKFVKQYMNGALSIKEALNNYVEDVKSRQFPDEDHSY
jgi:3-methyl-2-oxobutanoate hydroxymethyltransferase